MSAELSDSDEELRIYARVWSWKWEGVVVITKAPNSWFWCLGLFFLLFLDIMRKTAQAARASAGTVTAMRMISVSITDAATARTTATAIRNTDS